MVVKTNRFGIPFWGRVGEFTTHCRTCFSGWIWMFTGVRDFDPWPDDAECYSSVVLLRGCVACKLKGRHPFCILGESPYGETNSFEQRFLIK